MISNYYCDLGGEAVYLFEDETLCLSAATPLLLCLFVKKDAENSTLFKQFLNIRICFELSPFRAMS